MLICYIESGYPPPNGGGGGAGTYVQLVGRELVRRGHSVTVLAAWYPGCSYVYDDQGIQVYRPRIRRPMHWYLGKWPVLRTGSLSLRYLEGGWRQYRFLQKLHREHPFDLVEFTEGGDFWHAWSSTFPYIVHLHGSHYTFLKQSNRPVGRDNWWQRRLELAFIKRADHVISPSQALLNIVRKESGTLNVQSTVIPYPLDPRLLRKNGAESKRPRRVLFAARNDPVKGAASLLEAIPPVNEEISGVEFHFFGYQPRPEEAIPPNVVIHPFVPRDELLCWYQKVDICVVPSIWDNSPNTVYEAMGAGTPVIATSVGGIPELVEDGHTGLLVPPNDPRTLASAICRLLCNLQESAQMGDNARSHVRKLADLDQNVDRRLQLFNEVTNARYA